MIKFLYSILYSTKKADFLVRFTICSIVQYFQNGIIKSIKRRALGRERDNLNSNVCLALIITRLIITNSF